MNGQLMKLVKEGWRPQVFYKDGLGWCAVIVSSDGRRGANGVGESPQEALKAAAAAVEEAGGS